MVQNPIPAFICRHPYWGNLNLPGDFLEPLWYSFLDEHISFFFLALWRLLTDDLGNSLTDDEFPCLGGFVQDFR